MGAIGCQANTNHETTPISITNNDHSSDEVTLTTTTDIDLTQVRVQVPVITVDNIHNITQQTAVNTDTPLVVNLAWSSDSQQLAVGGVKTQILDIFAPSKLQTLREEDPVINDMLWSPDNTKLALTSMDKSLQILDVVRTEEIHGASGIASNTNHLAWVTSEAHLVLGHEDHSLETWNAETGNSLMHFKGHTMIFVR